MKPTFEYTPMPVISPKPGCPWADTMVLNPAIVKDPESNTIHMLFRATGPYPQKRADENCRDPYPICLGYARSDDLGKTWEADFSTPALAPSVEYRKDLLYIMDDEGKRVINYINGCVEDPRIFELEGQLYLTVAGRMFPPGPYWDLNPIGMINTPDWAFSEDLSEWIDNTTSVLYKLDIMELKNRNYRKAFTYVCNLTNPVITDNRDVFFFPEKMKINGKLQYVMLHRPHNPEAFEAGRGHKKPSIMLAASESIKDFPSSKATHKFLAEGIFHWEQERIGASWPPIRISEKEWLLQYHGKTMPGYGYTQSFLILKEVDNDFPQITHRCSERLMYAQQEWELPDKFMCPCLFTTGGIVIGDKIIMSYGAADQKVGIAWVDFNEIVAYVKSFDANGNEMKI
jgi:predicted GH43/DUF377 family glycosyl hydrolase